MSIRILITFLFVALLGASVQKCVSKNTDPNSDARSDCVNELWKRYSASDKKTSICYTITECSDRVKELDINFVGACILSNNVPDNAEEMLKDIFKK